MLQRPGRHGAASQNRWLIPNPWLYMIKKKYSVPDFWYICMLAAASCFSLLLCCTVTNVTLSTSSKSNDAHMNGCRLSGASVTACHVNERLKGTWYGQAITGKIPGTITFLLLACRVRIVIFLLLLLCQAVSIFNLFCLHHQGIQILVILHTMLSTIQSCWDKLLLDLIHLKSKLFLFIMVDVILCSSNQPQTSSVSSKLQKYQVSTSFHL
jgi:hypothetical protein